MAKADADGVYVLNGHRYKIRKGDTVPDGAEVEEGQQDAPAKRAKGAAPENRAKDEKAETPE